MRKLIEVWFIDQDGRDQRRLFDNDLDAADFEHGLDCDALPHWRADIDHLVQAIFRNPLDHI
jgi:hypothetical protein